MTSLFTTVAFADERAYADGETETECPAMRGESDRRNDKDQAAIKSQPKSKTTETSAQ